MYESKVEIVQEADLVSEIAKAREIDIDNLLKPTGAESVWFIIGSILGGFWKRNYIGFRALLILAVSLPVSVSGVGLIWIILHFLRVIDFMFRYKNDYVTLGTFLSSILLVAAEIGIIGHIIAN